MRKIFKVKDMFVYSQDLKTFKTIAVAINLQGDDKLSGDRNF